MWYIRSVLKKQRLCFTYSTLTWEEGNTFCNAKVVGHATAHLVSIDSDEVNELVCTADFVKYRFLKGTH